MAKVNKKVRKPVKKAPVRHKEWKEVFSARIRKSVQELAEIECQRKYGKTLVSAMEGIVMRDLGITEEKVIAFNNKQNKKHD